MTKVILNGSPVYYKYNMISYDDIVRFALGDTRDNVIYNITFSKGLLGCKGSLFIGDTFPIVDGTIINAVITGNG